MKELINDKLNRENEEILKTTFTPKINDYSRNIKRNSDDFQDLNHLKNKITDIKSDVKEIDHIENNLKDKQSKSKKENGRVNNLHINEKLNFTFND